VALKQNSFETGSGDGVAVSVANSDDASAGDALNSVNIGTTGTIAYETTNPAHGSQCVAFTQGTAANACWVDGADTAATSFSTRFYLYLSGYPSAAVQFPCAARSGTDTHVTRLQMTTTGTMQVLDTAGNTLYTTVAVPLSTWTRIEYWGRGMNSTDGAIGVAVYAGDSTTPSDFGLRTGVTTTNTIGRIRWGKFSSATLGTWNIDDVAWNIGSDVPLGPFGGWTQYAYSTSVQIG
jgi:hypothetical protein